jgi:1-acyl-sn-glycerol-3-phosphate acyltransferase
MSWLGFVGVDQSGSRGAVDFLRTGEAILSEPNRVYWVTAQGRFADVRDRPLNLRSGVGYLAARLKFGAVVPLALEYTFWMERTPEALVRFGPALTIPETPNMNGKEWTARIEAALTQNLDTLNAETSSRDAARFTTLLEGRAGVGGVYDAWRRLKAWLRGERFDPSHGGQP